MLTFALSKGRLLEPSLRLLECVGLWVGDPPMHDGVVLESGDVRFILVRDDDVPTYVSFGAADLGIVGKDVLLEQSRDVVELEDLRACRCRLVLAAPAGTSFPPGRTLKVATKYPAIAEAFFSRKGYPTQIIRVHGAAELAPKMGLADAVMDLVQTGRTLARNGLVEIEEVLVTTARLIANPASFMLKHGRLRQVAEALARAAASGGDEDE